MKIHVPSHRITAQLFQSIPPRSDIFAKLYKAVSGLSDRNLDVIIRTMPLPYVRKMDVREQFWRLGIPVDVALLFYDPDHPEQPTARKLRSAFPKTKICLCGNDSHLRDTLSNHGELPPPQWTLDEAIADDFIVEVFVCLL